MDNWINTANNLMQKSRISMKIYDEDVHVTHQNGEKPLITSRDVSKDYVKNACFFLCGEI